jgi:uncharacterized protein (DUF58 family)
VIAATLTPESKRATAVSRGRLAFGLTRKSLLLLAAGLLWLVPAFFLYRFVWGLLMWDGLVLVLAALDGIRLPASRLIEAERSWSSAPALGNRTEVVLSVRHHGSEILHLSAVDDLPQPFLEFPPTLHLQGYPNISARVRYTFISRMRGDHPAGKLYLRYRSHIGLIERWAVCDLTQTVRIYPQIRAGEDQALFLARTRQIELQQRKQRQRGMGRDFESLRDYREGDDLRDICWTAAARRGALISKQYQTEKSQPVWVMMDAGRLLQARVGSYTKLDYAAATALAIAQLALLSGDRVGLFAYGRDIQQRVALGRGGAHLRQLMESLAIVRGEPGEADHLRATVTLNRMQPRRSLILWLTDLAETAMRPEVVDGAAQLLRRHLVLFVAIQQKDLGEIAASRPANVTQMFERAAAQELLQRRELLLAKLRERGALTLETAPEAMTASVLNRYLEIKEKSLL